MYASLALHSSCRAEAIICRLRSDLWVCVLCWKTERLSGSCLLRSIRRSLSLLLIMGTECIRGLMFCEASAEEWPALRWELKIAHQRLIKLMHTYCCQDLIKHAGEMHKDTKWHQMKRENINLSGLCKVVSSAEMCKLWFITVPVCTGYALLWSDFNALNLI